MGRRVPVEKVEECGVVKVGEMSEESAKILCGEDVVSVSRVLIVDEDRGAESDVYRRVHELREEDLEEDLGEGGAGPSDRD